MPDREGQIAGITRHGAEYPRFHLPNMVKHSTTIRRKMPSLPYYRDSKA
jgi:hypothetical protein